MSLDAHLANSAAIVNNGYATLRARSMPEALDVLEALHEHHLAMLYSVTHIPRLATEALAAALRVETKPLAEMTALDPWSKRAPATPPPTPGIGRPETAGGKPLRRT